MNFRSAFLFKKAQSFSLLYRNSRYAGLSKKPVRPFTTTTTADTGIQKLTNGHKALLCSMVGVNLTAYFLCKEMWYYTRGGLEEAPLHDFMRRCFSLFPFSIQPTPSFFNFHNWLTALFLYSHADHLAFNMLAFCTLGVQMLPVIGASKFLTLYFGGIIAANCSHEVYPYIKPGSRQKHWDCYQAKTADGGVFSLLAYYLLGSPLPMHLKIAIGVYADSIENEAKYTSIFDFLNAQRTATFGGILFGGTYYFLTRRSPVPLLRKI
jgi:membrane associated rhomboid family serine protease